jgi:ribosome modulation factor
MTIETIKAIVDQGAQAFADGKKTDVNPYVNNPEHHMHWLTGYNQAAMNAEPVAAEQAPAETEQTPAGTEQTPAETQTEEKASKKSKE